MLLKQGQYPWPSPWMKTLDLSSGLSSHISNSLQHLASLLIYLDHISTLVRIGLTKTFSTTIPLKEIEYLFKNSKMNKDIILASPASASELISN
jgi:hypothetical protein